MGVAVGSGVGVSVGIGNGVAVGSGTGEAVCVGDGVASGVRTTVGSGTGEGTSAATSKGVDVGAGVGAVEGVDVSTATDCAPPQATADRASKVIAETATANTGESRGLRHMPAGVIPFTCGRSLGASPRQASAARRGPR